MNRLVGFWRQRSRRGKTLLLVAAVLALGGVVAVIGAATSPDEEATVQAERHTTTEVNVSSAPIRCLDAAGLAAVEEQDVNVWRGFDDGRAYAIIVRKLPTPAKAPTVVAGTYAVTGRFKVLAKGTGLTVEEGLQADLLVQLVADCLGD